MKKHRSLLLMGTLIAPILLTTGDALATSGINDTPKSTSVMIHAITDVSDSDPADAPTLWGSGEEKDLKTLTQLGKRQLAQRLRHMSCQMGL